MRWEQKEIDLVHFYINQIQNKKISIYKATLNVQNILIRTYDSCYSKIQRERKKLKK